jgi:membrane fusion protein (multidrug efflux system)
LPSCHSKKTEQRAANAAPPPVELKAVVAVPRMIEDKIYATGSVLANEEVEIRAEVPGRITSINFQEGSAVRKGDLLVKINDSELQAQLKMLRLEEKLAADDVFRKEKLIEMKAISQEELDIAVNQLGVIRARIDLVASQIEKTSIFAPFSGRIGLRYASPGGYISSSMLIARMQQNDPVKIDFNIPEKYMGNINAGKEIQFTIAGSDSLFSGTIYAVEPRIDPSTRTFTARARCLNPGGLIAPGAFAKVSITLETIPDALVLPTDAIATDIRGEKVFLSRNGKAVTAYVGTGIHTEKEVQVISGIKANDTILITGLMQVRDQMSVRPRITEIK